MDALHALPCPSDTTARTWSRPAGSDPSITLGRVARMGIRDGASGDLRLGHPHTAGRLQAAHGSTELGVDQPVTSRHGRAVVEQGLVRYDDWSAVSLPDHDLEGARRRASEQLGDGIEIARVVLAQRQNSSVCSMRSRVLSDLVLDAPDPLARVPLAAPGELPECAWAVEGATSELPDGVTGPLFPGSPA